MMVSAIYWVMLGIAAAVSAARQPRCGTAYSLAIGINRNNMCHNRLQKELAHFRQNPPPNCKLEVFGARNDIWIVTWTGIPDTLYAGETYRLKILFPKEYPLKPPIIYFLQPAPVHPHVYSNGDICMSSLGSDYLPTASVTSFVLSIISMLSTAKEKQLPMDNHLHAELPPGSSDARYLYHDDKC
ncbi:ubiquitin-conjugating enzyme E2 [Babesia divergens]|uniref:Ubiquitin-conjugating enzyme E2 n=1 Tax=Babesia divergens TaxID=32595 RepID=A0AAD9GKH9_BABDI|nr:ubiquitin-conjugating enzyme E2 [Babesia divergens]